MPSHRRLALLISSVALFFCAATARAQRSPGEVLIVYNADSPISTAIADDYAAMRHVPNKIAVRCVDSALSPENETIPFAEYTKAIAAPVGAYLAAHKNINFIVLTKGIPIRIAGALTGAGVPGSAGPWKPSLDSYLAAIDYAGIPGAVKASLRGSGTVGTAWINRYYNATDPFTHARFGGYLVTRLDGYTQADAMGLVRQALTAEQRARPDGKFLLDVQSDFGLGDKTAQPLRNAAEIVAFEAAWSTRNADMLRASDMLEASGVDHETNTTKSFVGNRSNLLGYFSWGSNDNHFESDHYDSLRFAPGSIGDTAVSTSARTFLPSNWGQTLIADLVAHGLTCCQGYVYEPLLDGMSSPTIDLSHYLAGFTMAESFYAGTPYIGWEGVCVGDPLCCPYARRKLVTPKMAASFNGWAGRVEVEPCLEGGFDLGSIRNGDYTAYDGIILTGAHRFSSRIAGAGLGGNIEIRLDSPVGTLIGTCAVSSTGGWQTWRTVSCELSKDAVGTHRLCLVYKGGHGPLFNVEWFAFR